MLCSMHILSSPSEETYTNTTLSTALLDDSTRCLFLLGFDISSPAVLQLPTYLASRHWRQPNDKTSTAIHTTHSIPVDGKTTYFNWIAAHPSHRSTFHSAMRAQTISLFGSATFYPFDTVLSSSSSPAIVDIGGGRGQSLIQITETYPALLANGTKFYLQELGPVIAEAKAQGLPPCIEAQTHDFFRPQPIRGARIYHLSQILHDWPDADAVLILRHVVDAMDKKSSRVLIVDRCLPDKDVPPEMAMLDLYMMALAAGVERGERQWRELLGQAGLELVKVWRVEGFDLAGIEARVAGSRSGSGSEVVLNAGGAA